MNVQMKETNLSADELAEFGSKVAIRKAQIKELNLILETALKYDKSPFKVYIHVEIEKPLAEEEIVKDSFDDLMDKIRDADNPKEFLKNLTDMERSLKSNRSKKTIQETLSVHFNKLSNVEFIGIVESLRNKCKDYIRTDLKTLSKINNFLKKLNDGTETNE